MFAVYSCLTSHRGRCDNNRGTTLIELLFSLLLSTLVATMAFATTRTMLDSMRRHDCSASIAQNADAALDLMLREIQMAGCARALTGNFAFGRAEATSLQVLSDLNADGDSDDANERVTYALNADKALLTRASGRGTPQPLLRGVAVQGLRLHYYDRGGVELSGGGADFLQRIAAVRIELTLSPADDQLAPTHIERTAALRNL